jgi:hypothetical protein
MNIQPAVEKVEQNVTLLLTLAVAEVSVRNIVGQEEPFSSLPMTDLQNSQDLSQECAIVQLLLIVLLY